jgi:magnesium chelatase family protein
MAIAVAQSRAVLGIDAPRVTVEVHLGGGLPSLSVVGLPNTAVREARDRVRSALANSGFDFPSRRITVSLAPADLPKDGARFDLAIALGILAASRQIPRQALTGHTFAAELGLSGELRPVNAILPVALQCARSADPLIVAESNGAEASLAGGAVYPAAHLLDVCRHLTGEARLSPAKRSTPEATPIGRDLVEVIGQRRPRRTLEIAAAGGHSLLLKGPPGSGKSLLAETLPGLLPPMADDEAMESAAIHSLVDGNDDPTRLTRRPFRSPHHSASPTALTGGGNRPRPGEISLAHHGVLFLDELPEFPRQALETLREPLETGEIRIARANRRMRFPARFQLIAAMNPCPCGFLGDQTHECRCTPAQIQRYQQRISGPLLDRIDMAVEVPRLPPDELTDQSPGECSKTVARRVAAARDRQMRRDSCPAARLAGQRLRRQCRLDGDGRRVMEDATRRFGLSARGWHRTLRVARTIADLDDRDAIQASHLLEAIGYRQPIKP